MKVYGDRVYNLAAMSEKDKQALAAKYPQLNIEIGDNKQGSINDMETEPRQVKSKRSRKRKSDVDKSIESNDNPK